MKRILLFSVLAALICVSCTKDNFVDNGTDGESAYNNTKETRSYEEMRPEDFRVSYQEVQNYIFFKSKRLGYNWAKNAGGLERPQFYPSKNNYEIIAYPKYPETPSIYIINFPDFWEILSTDKRTETVIASGRGQFNFDEINPNLAGYIKDLAADIAALHSYAGEIKYGKENYLMWTAILNEGARLSEKFETTPFFFEPLDLSTLTKAGSGPDTTYHPEPGHYEVYGVIEDYVVTNQVGPLTTTKWGELSNYNQYCPFNHNSGHAPAGSEAVAGGQMVYFMHHAADCCPEVYKYASVTSFFDDDAACSGMEQTDKSAANWAFFNSSDSVRMAAVMLANIGKKMDMTYGARYSYGEFEALQRALNDEYELKSFLVGFNNSGVNPYNEIRSMLLDYSIPSIIHSSGSQYTNPYTFIVDRCGVGIRIVTTTYIFRPDDLTHWTLYHNSNLPTAIESYAQTSFFGMNWGSNGAGDDVWVVDSGNWHIGELDHSNREAMLSFRMDGSEPGGNGGGQR